MNAARHEIARFSGSALLTILLLSACASSPPPPDWQANAHGAIKDFSQAYLVGNSRVAALEFARANNEISSTGRADLMARAQAVRCAVRVASLEFDNCQGFEGKLADAAAPPERAYVNFLSGRWQALETAQIALLPEHHRALITAQGDASTVAALSQITDPLARLVGAGALLQMGRLPPAGITLAVNAASAQGWRRPLLAWLGVELKLARAAGDAAAVIRTQTRIDLVLNNTPR